MFIHTSKEGTNLLSFSTPITIRGPALSIDLVSAPGPGPTSQTHLSFTLPATRTILSAARGRGKLIGRDS